MVDTESWLKQYITDNGGVAGTLHVREGAALILKAHVNIPPPVVLATRSIPKGKGMAGLAWERKRAVTTCNLTEDNTGDVRPGAKAVQAQAALAVPVKDTSGEVTAVVGLAFSDEREFSDDDLARFEQSAARFSSEAG